MIRRYSEDDFVGVMEFLGNHYKKFGYTAFLPSRLEDLVYRVEILSTVDRGLQSYLSRCFVVLEEGVVKGFIPYDGAYYYIVDEVDVRTLQAFISMVEGAVALEQPYSEYIELFKSQEYYQCEEIEYICAMNLSQQLLSAKFPLGYYYASGSERSSWDKVFACERGFHPELTVCPPNIANYFYRETAPSFWVSRERIVIGPDDEIVGYMFCWVDVRLKVAFVEPLCVLEEHRRKGIGKALVQSMFIELKKSGIETCWVNPVGDWRRDFYVSCGFEQKGEITFWDKEKK